MELFENLFLTDLATTRQLNAYTAQNEIYQDATFFTKGTKQLDEVMARVNKLPVNWRKYQLNKNSQELAGVTGAVNGVYGPDRRYVVGDGTGQCRSDWHGAVFVDERAQARSGPALGNGRAAVKDYAAIYR